MDILFITKDITIEILLPTVLTKAILNFIFYGLSGVRIFTEEKLKKNCLEETICFAKMLGQFRLQQYSVHDNNDHFPGIKRFI